MPNRKRIASAISLLLWCMIDAHPDNPPRPSFNSTADSRFTNTSLVTYLTTAIGPGWTYSAKTFSATTETLITDGTTVTGTDGDITGYNITRTGTTYTGFLGNSTVTATTSLDGTYPSSTFEITRTGYTIIKTKGAVTNYASTQTGYTETYTNIMPGYCPPPGMYLPDSGTPRCNINWGDNQTGLVAVFYWPSPESDFSCVVNNDTREIYISLPSSCPSTANKTISPSAHLPTAAANHSGFSTAIVSGYTFTSPSIYLSVGAVSGLGITLNNVLLSFAPGELQTGAIREAVGPFNPADFPCPPCSKFLTDNSYKYERGGIVTTYGPNIAPLQTLLSLVPQWAACSCNVNIWAGQDPPIALTGMKSVSPASTTLAHDPQVITADPKTGSTASPGTARSTQNRATVSSSLKPDPTTLDPSTNIAQPQTASATIHNLPSSSDAIQQLPGDPSVTHQAPTSLQAGQQGAANDQASVGSPTLHTDPLWNIVPQQATTVYQGDPGNLQISATDMKSQQRVTIAYVDPSAPMASRSSQGDPNTQTSSASIFGGQGGSRAAAFSKGGLQNVAGGQGGSNTEAASEGSQAHSVTHQTEAGNRGGQGDQASQLFPSQSGGGQVVVVQSTTNIGAEVSRIAASLVGIAGSRITASESNPQVVPGSGIGSSTYGPSSGSSSSGSQQDTSRYKQTYPAQTPYYVGGNSQTLTLGSLPITLFSQIGSLVASGSSLVLDGTTFDIAGYEQPATTVNTFDSKTFVSTIGSQLVVHGQTFSQASQLASTILGVPAATTAVFTHIPGQNPVFSIDGSPITALAEPSRLIVSGATLLPGGPAVTISGTPISLDVGGSTLVLGSSTVPIPAQATTLRLKSSTLTANSAGKFAIGDQTLAAGAAAITVSGTLISLAMSDAYAVLDGSTVFLSAAALTIGGQVLTPTAGAGYIVDGRTLSPGGSAITADGTVLSLAPTTGPWTSGALASFIVSGLGGAPTDHAQTYTGTGEIKTPRILGSVLLMAVGIAVFSLL